MAAAGLQAPALVGPLARPNALSLAGVSLLSPGRRDDSPFALAGPSLCWLAPARRTATTSAGCPRTETGAGAGLADTGPT